MFKSYEAIYEHGQIKWIQDQPPIETARVIVTVLEAEAAPRRRVPPASIAGKGKTLGDIVSPVVDERDWELLW